MLIQLMTTPTPQYFDELTSFWAWLAFVGNAMTAVFTYQILRLVRQTPPAETEYDHNLLERIKTLNMSGRPWYYVISILSVATWQTYRAVQPFIYPIGFVDWQSSVSQFLVGLMFASVWCFYRYGSGTKWTVEQIKNMAYQLYIGIAVSVAIMFALGMRYALRRNNDIFERQVKVEENRKSSDSTQAIQTGQDTVKFGALEDKVDRIDTTTQQLKQQSLSNKKK